MRKIIIHHPKVDVRIATTQSRTCKEALAKFKANPVYHGYVPGEGYKMITIDPTIVDGFKASFD